MTTVYYKATRPDGTSFYDRETKWEVGATVRVPRSDAAREPSCCTPGRQGPPMRATLTAYLDMVTAAAELDRDIAEQSNRRDILARQCADLVLTDELDLLQVTAEMYGDAKAELESLEQQRRDAGRRMEEALADLSPRHITDPDSLEDGTT